MGVLRVGVAPTNTPNPHHRNFIFNLISHGITYSISEDNNMLNVTFVYLCIFINSTIVTFVKILLI